jgi:hypothetical protein
MRGVSVNKVVNVIELVPYIRLLLLPQLIHARIHEMIEISRHIG